LLLAETPNALPDEEHPPLPQSSYLLPERYCETDDPEIRQLAR
jgi:hypothetical protein